VARLSKRYPSPAMAVAFVALLAALSGTAVALPGKNSVDSGDLRKGAVKRVDIAKNAVTGKKVKGSSLTGSDVKANSIGGSDVNEGSLGKVPSAASADNAANANSANTAANANAVNGINATKISLVRNVSNVTQEVIYQGNGFILRGGCTAGAERVVADTTVAGGELSSVGDDAGGGADFDVKDDDFNPGDNLVLTPPTPNDQVYTINYSGGDGKFVTVRLATEGLTNLTCEISGIAFGA
jgi:hypothetical protein